MINYSVELLSPGISPTRHYAAMKVFLARTPRHHPALVLPWCHGAGSSYVRCQSALTGPSQQPGSHGEVQRQRVLPLQHSVLAVPVVGGQEAVRCSRDASVSRDQAPGGSAGTMSAESEHSQS